MSLPPFISRPHCHRTDGPLFRTDAEGNIALSRDWPALLGQIRRFPLVVLQTRNAWVRLITLAPFPALSWSPARDRARDDGGALLLDASRWCLARGRLSPCACCGSAGRIRIFDTTGAECLQLCAYPGTGPAEWAACLAAFAAPLNAAVRPVPRGVFNRGERFAAAPGATRHAPSLLPVLIDLFVNEEAPVSCALHTPGATQRRTLTPRRVSCEQGLLTVADGVHTLQIVLPALDHLSVGSRRIDLVSLDGTSLLSLSPAATPDGACLWSAILHTALSRI